MKRLVSILLFLVVLCSMTIGAGAKTIDTYGDWVIEKINDGAAWNLDSYIGDSTEVKVPWVIYQTVVRKIGEHCMAKNSVIRSVTTQTPLNTIGDYAFIDCTALESVTLCETINYIGVGAFSGDEALVSANLEDTVIERVESYSFLKTALSEVVLPDTCRSIGVNAFAACTDLSKIVIPDSVTEIDDSAFLQCESLVIYAKADSYAIEYAIAHSIDYVITDAPVEVTYMVGDADGDGAITILDATKIQRLLVSLITDDDGMIALRGDSNGNGLDILDATRIQRYLADFTVVEPIGETVTITL